MKKKLRGKKLWDEEKRYESSKSEIKSWKGKKFARGRHRIFSFHEKLHVLLCYLSISSEGLWYRLTWSYILACLMEMTSESKSRHSEVE